MKTKKLYEYIYRWYMKLPPHRNAASSIGVREFSARIKGFILYGY